MIRAIIKHFSLVSIISSLLQAFGTLWLFVEITAFFFPEPWPSTIRSLWWLFFVIGILVGLYRAWPKLSVKERISETDIDIEVRVGDLIFSDGAIIVGSNTTFDTALEDGTISADSLQGQFTNKFCPSIPELDQKISIALREMLYSERKNTDKPFGKIKEYQFGTIAPIEVGGKRAYFVAVAKLNEHRVAVSDRNEFLDSLPRMWEGIRNRGGFEPLCCPILGSGFSRLNLPREQLLQEIIKSFVAASIEAKFCEKLTIFVHWKDFQHGHVDLLKIGSFLEYQCSYARSSFKSTNSGPIGIPMG